MNQIEFFMKSYAELSDHLITLAIALLTLSVTFIDKLKANLKTKRDYNLFIILWVLLVSSIFLGLLSAYSGVNSALACADNNPNTLCGTSVIMEFSLLINLIFFFTALVILASIGYKSLASSQADLNVVKPNINSVSETVATKIEAKDSVQIREKEISNENKSVTDSGKH